MRLRTVGAVIRLAGLALIVWSVISAADFVTAALFMRGSLDDGFTTSHLVQGFIGIVIRFVCGIILMLIAPVFARYAVSVADDVTD